MNVLVACEFSGTVRDAFRALGHNAWSCDLLDADVVSGVGHVYHLKGDVRRVLNGSIPFDMVGDSAFRPSPLFIKWDLMIAHPPCTFVCVSGLHWNKRGRLVDGRPRAELTAEAVEFVRELLAAPIPRIAIENPIGCLSTQIRKPDQIVQPYMFGDDASKATCFWLTCLPKLQTLPVDQWVQPRMVNGKPRWANQTDGGQNRLGPSADRWALRSITYPGVASAIAGQWAVRS